MDFDFKELAGRAFLDNVGPSFPKWFKNNKDVFVVPALNNFTANSAKGKKYFMQLTLSNEGDRYTFPHEPLVSLGLTKTIIETPTVGKDRKGAVLEYITTENWQITIKGVCVDLDNPEVYPGEQVKALEDFFAENKSMDVVDNKFFELFEVRKMVLRDIFFEEMMGMPGVQKYVISAISDSDFYADLDSNNRNQVLS